MQPPAAINTWQPRSYTVRQLGHRVCEVECRQLRRGRCKAAPALLQHPSAESEPAANSRLQSLRLITAIRPRTCPAVVLTCVHSTG